MVTPYQKKVITQLVGPSNPRETSRLHASVEKALSGGGASSDPSAETTPALRIEWDDQKVVRVVRENIPVDDDIRDAFETYGDGLVIRVGDVTVFCPAIDPMSPDSPLV